MDRFSSEYYDLIQSKLYTAVLVDVMDELGYRDQCFRPDIRPLYPEAKVTGRAATMLSVDVYEMPAEPYKLELRLLDELTPGEVVVCTSQGSRRAGLWGELLSTHARARGGRGAIMDGLARDAESIIQMRFPVFVAGLIPADSKGRLDVVDIRVPIDIGGVTVSNGDLIVGDFDGCIAIPRAVEDETIGRALEKVSKENVVRDILRQGANIQAVFKEHGVL